MFTTRNIVKKAYTDWIRDNIPKDEQMGECTTWTRAMKMVFPELIHVGGYAYGAMFFGSARAHYHEYLVDPVDGDIIDPTAKQFDMMCGKGDWHYERYEEHLIL